MRKWTGKFCKNCVSLNTSPSLSTYYKPGNNVISLFKGLVTQCIELKGIQPINEIR